MSAAAASSPSLAFAPNYESADGIDYGGLSAIASLSMADSACEGKLTHIKVPEVFRNILSHRRQ